MSAFMSVTCGRLGAGLAPAITHHHHLRQALIPSQTPSSRLHFTYQSCLLPLTFRSREQPLRCSAVSLQLVQEEKLVEEQVVLIREELASLEEASRKGDRPLIECLRLVDLIQRLGIQRNFKQEIKRILKTTYMTWDEKFGLHDAEVTLLAFRLLRLQGYHVSADVLQTLKDESGNFSCFLDETSPTAIMGMLYLYKCSQISFAFESKIMGEAMTFSGSQLNKALLEGDQSSFETNNLRFEVKFALNYPRRHLLPRLESRSMVRQQWPSKGYERKCFEVARQDLEVLQKQYKEDMGTIERWREEKAVEEFRFNQGHILKIFFLTSATLFEPQFSAYRVAFTKNASLTVYVDDIFDNLASDYDGICRFVEAVQRWDSSPLDNLPKHKAAFKCLHSVLIETATESSKAQGRDLLPFYKKMWQDMIAWYFKETEWRHNQHIPTLDEYLENGCYSIAATTCYCTSMFLLGEPVTDEVARHVGRGSRLLYLVGLIARVTNDLVSFKREAMDGETVTAISCYMRANPWCTEEEAIASLQQMVDSAWVEVEWQLFSCSSSVPECFRLAVLSLALMYYFSYKNGDGYTDSTDMEFAELYQDYLYGSLR